MKPIFRMDDHPFEVGQIWAIQLWTKKEDRFVPVDLTLRIRSLDRVCRRVTAYCDEDQTTREYLFDYFQSFGRLTTRRDVYLTDEDIQIENEKVGKELRPGMIVWHIPEAPTEADDLTLVCITDMDHRDSNKTWCVKVSGNPAQMYSKRRLRH